MAMEWKEIDVFGKSNQIYKKNFAITSSMVSFGTFETVAGGYKAHSTLVRKFSVTSFPNYKYCTKEDFICTSKVTLNIGGSAERPNINIYISDYNADTGEISLEADCKYTNNPGSDIELLVQFNELIIYGLYGVTVKSI